jgi:hypothetical protein
LFNCGQSYKHSSRGSIKRHLLACFRTHRPALKQLSDAQVHTLLAGGRKPERRLATSSQRFARSPNRLTPHCSSSGLLRTRRVQHPEEAGGVCAVQDERITSGRLSGDHIECLVHDFTPCNIRRTCPPTIEEARVSKPQLDRSATSCNVLITNDLRLRDVSTQTTSSFHVVSPSSSEATSLW